MSKFTHEQRAVLTAVEEHYLTKGEFPSMSWIANRTDLTNTVIFDILQMNHIKSALDTRGIAWSPVDEKQLNARQIACIEAILNIHDNRPTTHKLKSLGIHPQTYYGWKRKPHFMEAYKKAARELYSHSIPDLHQVVMKRALDGDVAMIKTALAISGEWDDKKSVEAMNIQFVLAKVLEVIQKNVKDKEALISISQEFDQLVNPTRKAIGS